MYLERPINLSLAGLGAFPLPGGALAAAKIEPEIGAELEISAIVAATGRLSVALVALGPPSLVVAADLACLAACLAISLIIMASSAQIIPAAKLAGCAFCRHNSTRAYFTWHLIMVLRFRLCNNSRRLDSASKFGRASPISSANFSPGSRM